MPAVAHTNRRFHYSGAPLRLETGKDDLHPTPVGLATGIASTLWKAVGLVGVVGIISLFKGPAKLFGVVGVYSYGLYLIHQPYVIWLGLRIREQPLWMFLLITAATLTVLSAWGIVLEKATNMLLDKVIPAKKKA